MSSVAKIWLGYAALSKKIHLAKMAKHGDGTATLSGSGPRADVTNEAAQLVWQLCIDEGGVIWWEKADGSIMVLTASLLNNKGVCDD